MRREVLDITALAAWAKLHGVAFHGVSVEETSGRGFGLVAKQPLSAKPASDALPLLEVPRELILSGEFVENHAKTDKHFRTLLGAAGGVSTRHDMLLFLLMQLTMTSPDTHFTVGVSNPWTEYVKFLPSKVPLPTMWSEEQRKLLAGTSLEHVLTGKLRALQQEFDKLKECTSVIPWCRQAWWNNGSITVRVWTLLDAWYRSRCLELPDSGPCMVPCIDMVNHQPERGLSSNASYEQSGFGGAELLLAPYLGLNDGDEVTIDYGPLKGAAEMLFSYGFIPVNINQPYLLLPVEPLPDDPLGKAKVVAFRTPPHVSLRIKPNGPRWESPFAYFMCLNEEDGLEFKLARQLDGSVGPLLVFWLGEDVTDSVDQFEQHILKHELRDIFKLRAISALQTTVSDQLERLRRNVARSAGGQESPADATISSAALKLREAEISILEKVSAEFNDQVMYLMRRPSVQAYLGSMNESPSGQADEAIEATGEGDFS